MELDEYKKLVEGQRGVISLPSNDEEIRKILNALEESLESVSEIDFRILQAMMVVNEWGKTNVQSGKQT